MGNVFKHRGVAVCVGSQKGATLVELLVGVTIGLLVITVGIAALSVIRSVSSTVDDTSRLQQQAAYAFRVIGQQLRQAGSLRLDLAYGKEVSDPILLDDRVAFDSTFNRTTGTVKGNDAPGAGDYELEVGYQNYVELVLPPTGVTPQLQSLMRDCLGNAGTDPLGTGTSGIIESRFVLVQRELFCAGSTNPQQALIKDVTDFRVSYLRQVSGPAGPTVQYVNAAAAAAGVPPALPAWGGVFAVEVCLELEGDQNSVPFELRTSLFRNCNGVDVQRGPNLRMVFRNTYQLRSQGQPV